MAQADSVPSSTRQLITGESASRSTNLPAVRTKPSDRGYFIPGSGARVIMGAEAAPLLRFRREKRSDVEPEDLSNRRWYGPSIGPIGSDIGAPFYTNAAFFLRWLLRSILLILLRVLNRKNRLSFSTFDKLLSDQSIRSRPQGRLK
jgi:hypothetical protein